MRAILVLLLVAGIAFAVVNRRSAKEQERRLAEEERAATKIIEQQAIKADAMRAEADRRMAVSMECDTAIGNRQVLHDAMKSGNAVFSFGGGPAPKTPEEMRAAFDVAQRFIDQNCADAVQARRGPGNAYCNSPHMKGTLVCL